MKVKTNVQGSSLHVSCVEQKADFISHSSSSNHPRSINEKNRELNFILSVGIGGLVHNQGVVCTVIVMQSVYSVMVTWHAHNALPMCWTLCCAGCEGD